MLSCKLLINASQTEDINFRPRKVLSFIFHHIVVRSTVILLEPRLIYEMHEILCFSLLAFVPMGMTDCDVDKQFSSKLVGDYDYSYDYQRQGRVCENKTITCENVTFPLSVRLEILESEGCPDVFLYIVDSNVPTVPPLALTVGYLTTLHMNNVGIQKIIPGTLNSFTSLKEIYLSGNNLTQIIPWVFSGLTNLTILDLSHNSIGEVMSHSLERLNNLKVLNLSFNVLSTFDASLSNSFKSIQNVDLSYNSFSYLDFNVFENVEVLNVSHNNIEDLACISKIKVLNLSNNKLTSLKNVNCSKYESLTEDLDASCNNISVIDVDVFKSLTALQKLQLQFNNITSLNIEVFSFHSNLTYLDLSHNKIQSFKHGLFERMESLAYLNISHNHLTSIDPYLYSLYNLVELSIESNHISSFNYEIFLPHFANLKIINIDRNNFSCQNLINILRYTKSLKSHKINIPYGDAREVSNIHGIACSEIDSDDGNIKSYMSNIITSKLNGFLNGSKQQNFMYDYFNKDFKSSNFYKYLEGLQKDDSVKISESKIAEYFDKEFQNSALYKLLENLKISENSTAEMNKSFYNYFNRDFRNSSFVRYLEGFRSEASKEISKTDMYNYFDKGFRNSSFFKYLENFKNVDVSRNVVDNEHNAEKLIKTSENDYTGLISIIIVVLIISILLNIVKFYLKNMGKAHNRNESVELFQS